MLCYSGYSAIQCTSRTYYTNAYAEAHCLFIIMIFTILMT